MVREMEKWSRIRITTKSLSVLEGYLLPIAHVQTVPVQNFSRISQAFYRSRQSNKVA